MLWRIWSKNEECHYFNRSDLFETIELAQMQACSDIQKDIFDIFCKHVSYLFMIVEAKKFNDFIKDDEFDKALDYWATCSLNNFMYIDTVYLGLEAVEIKSAVTYPQIHSFLDGGTVEILRNSVDSCKSTFKRTSDST